jgi:outer membrane protein OmpA-like peptidoglycan-associated protein
MDPACNSTFGVVTVHEVLSSSGQPLDSGTRSFMESRFGQDFSQVRVHTDQQAVQSAQAVDALAYTVRPHVVFGEGQFAPHTHTGAQLLAHELTHVLQQGDQLFTAGTALQLDDPADRSEQEAVYHAQQILNPDQEIPITGTVKERGVQRLQRQFTIDPRRRTANRGALEVGQSPIPSYEESMSQGVLTHVLDRNANLTLDSFASDSTELTEAHTPLISAYQQRIAQLLKQSPDCSIIIVGHTDATHTPEHNKELGQKRANAVMAALSTGEFAIPSAIMSAHSLGETVLRVETKNREPLNRRVEITFTPRRNSYRTLPPPSPSQPWTTTPPRQQYQPPWQQGSLPSLPRRSQPPITQEGASSPSPSLEEALSFKFNGVEVEIPKSVKVRLPLVLTAAKSLIFDLQAESSKTFSFSITLDDAKSHFRIAAKAQANIDKEKKATGSAGLEIQFMGNVCHADSAEGLRTTITEKGKELSTAIQELKTANPDERLEKLVDIAGAIGEMYSAVDKAKQACKQSPAATVGVGVQGPLGTPEAASPGTQPSAPSPSYLGVTGTVFF